MELKRVAVDTSKSVFTLHGIDQRDGVVLRANKMARVVWALMARGQEYRRSPVEA